MSTASRSGPISGRSSPRARRTPAAPDPALVGRFAADLDQLLPAGAKLGLAVSGGPDSLALLLLAAQARGGRIEAATVDHALRPGSSAEAEMVGDLCAALGVPHSTLAVEWDEKPSAAIQERARIERYRLLGGWAKDRRLDAVATAHHLDDQAETFVMRLNRGAGVTGLAAMRPASPLPAPEFDIPLLRPLLGWRRSELARICENAGVVPADDPSNADEQFERVRVRHGLCSADWLQAEGVAASARNLADADDALEWAARREWESQVSEGGAEIVYRPQAPSEIRRRILQRAIAALATEGSGQAVRGRELDKLLLALSNRGTATLRGVLCSGGEEWRFSRAPSRRSRSAPPRV